MLLKEHLKEYTKEQLTEEARLFELRGYSKLRKADLVDRLAEHFCSEDVMRSRFACLTKEQMSLFRRACVAPQELSIMEVMDGMQLHKYWIGYFEDPTDRFYVFEDVAEAFGRIDDEAFQAEQNKKGWLMKCVQFFANYYGIAPVEIVYELYKLKNKGTIEEMIDLLWELPVDIAESSIFLMEQLGMNNWPKEDPLYSSRGLLVHIPVLEDEELDHLLEQQRDKEFYIPSAQQLEEICGAGYEASALAYKKLEVFFMSKMQMPYERAFAWCFQVWANGYHGEAPASIINKMSESDVVFRDEKQMNEFVALLVEALNSTRMRENRGHNPNELAASRKEASANGAGGSTVRVEKKIYPNEPCPCGSGKKYKKCCGRN